MKYTKKDLEKLIKPFNQGLMGVEVWEANAYNKDCEYEIYMWDKESLANPAGIEGDNQSIYPNGRTNTMDEDFIEKPMELQEVLIVLQEWKKSVEGEDLGIKIWVDETETWHTSLSWECKQQIIHFGFVGYYKDTNTEITNDMYETIIKKAKGE